MDRELSDVRFLTVAEVADMMRVSSMTVYRMVHAGDLPAIRFGRSFRHFLSQPSRPPSRRPSATSARLSHRT